MLTVMSTLPKRARPPEIVRIMATDHWWQVILVTIDSSAAASPSFSVKMHASACSSLRQPVIDAAYPHASSIQPKRSPRFFCEHALGLLASARIAQGRECAICFAKVAGGKDRHRQRDRSRPLTISSPAYACRHGGDVGEDVLAPGQPLPPPGAGIDRREEIWLDVQGEKDHE